MEPKFDIDCKALTQQFKNYQRFIHPDKFEMAKEEMKDKAHELSSFANNAFSILSNDIERAEYLIRLGNKQCKEEGCNCDRKHEEEIIHDAEMMERVFELRMTISESYSP